MLNGLLAALLALILFLAMTPAQATAGAGLGLEGRRTSTVPIENYSQSGYGFRPIVDSRNVSQKSLALAESVSASAVPASAPQPGSMMLAGSALIAVGLALKKARKKA